MIERTKKLRESFWFWLFLTILSVLGFTASVIGFFSNSNITVRGRIAYLGVAGLLLLAAIVLAITAYGAWVQRQVNTLIDARIKQHLDERLVMVRTSHLQNVYQAFESGARAYGLFYEFQKVNCFVYQDGRTDIVRHAKLTAYTSVPEFHVYLLLPESDKEGGLKPPDIKCISKGHDLIAGKPIWSPGRQSSTIQIDPPLGDGDSVEFELHEGSDTQVFRTRKNRIKSETLDDYVFWDINYPTQRLEVTITLPPGMEIKSTTVDAVYSISGRNPSRHIQEYDRIRDLVVDDNQRGHHELSLIVDRPLLLVKYKLGWLPHPDYAEPGP